MKCILGDNLHLFLEELSFNNFAFLLEKVHDFVHKEAKIQHTPVTLCMCDTIRCGTEDDMLHFWVI